MNEPFEMFICTVAHLILRPDQPYIFRVDPNCAECQRLAELAKIPPRFSVVEYSSYYAVRDNETGKEHPMGDGVDTIFDSKGRAMSPGTEDFRLVWEASLNENPEETADAYFSRSR